MDKLTADVQTTQYKSLEGLRYRRNNVPRMYLITDVTTAQVTGKPNEYQTLVGFKLDPPQSNMDLALVEELSVFLRSYTKAQ